MRNNKNVGCLRLLLTTMASILRAPPYQTNPSAYVPLPYHRSALPRLRVPPPSPQERLSPGMLVKNVDMLDFYCRMLE